MSNKTLHILIEWGQIAALIGTVLSVTNAKAPGWLTTVLAVATALATWAKQEYGNTPQNFENATLSLFPVTPLAKQGSPLEPRDP